MVNYLKEYMRDNGWAQFVSSLLGFCKTIKENSFSGAIIISCFFDLILINVISSYSHGLQSVEFRVRPPLLSLRELGLGFMPYLCVKELNDLLCFHCELTDETSVLNGVVLTHSSLNCYAL